jgi:uncharacterized tellurite resistance protein B-like protein
MLLNLLSEEQKITFTRTALLVMSADGKNSDRELAFIDDAAREMELDELPSPAESLDEVLGLLDSMNTPLSQRVFLLELAGVAMADRILDPSEAEILQAVSDCFGVQDATLQKLIGLADRAITLADEALVLISTH